MDMQTFVMELDKLGYGVTDTPHYKCEASRTDG